MKNDIAQMKDVKPSQIVADANGSRYICLGPREDGRIQVIHASLMHFAPDDWVDVLPMDKLSTLGSFSLKRSR